MPDLIEDYFDFFDNRAFSDGSPYYPCYCNAFNLSLEQLKRDVFDKLQNMVTVKRACDWLCAHLPGRWFKVVLSEDISLMMMVEKRR